MNRFSLRTALVVCAASGTALAQPPPVEPIASAPPPASAPATARGLGAEGQVAIAGDFAIGFTYVADSEASALNLAPAIDYFLMPNLSIGGQVRLANVSVGDYSETAFAIGPRVGYVWPLAESFALYPRAGLYWQHVSAETDRPAPLADLEDDYSLFSLFIYAPALFVPVEHFFIGLGPQLSIDLAGATADRRTTSFGLLSTVGGWFDW